MATNSMIYLDNAATTRPDDAVFEAMLPYLKDSYANPSAAYSAAGRVRKAIGIAREQVAALINAEPDEIYFTSGGSESNNTAIKGFPACNEIKNGSNSMLTSNIEHPATLYSFAELIDGGRNVKFISPDGTGIISPECFADNITSSTGFASIMTANNEIGSVNDIAALGAICRERGIVFHTDAVQAVGHIPIDVRAMNIDMLSASGHKFHGPKGIGFLYVKRGIKLRPLIKGGGQERDLRSGTENVASIIGMGAAAEIAKRDMKEDYLRVASLRDLLVREVLGGIPDSILNGPSDMNRRLPGNANFSFKGIEGASLLIQLDIRNICASTGSACSASSARPSHVLEAIGLGKEYINGSIRLSLSKYTTQDEILRTVQVLKESVTALRTLCSD